MAKKIWLEYFLGVIIKAYKELEDRVGYIENTKGSKSERIIIVKVSISLIYRLC